MLRLHPYVPLHSNHMIRSNSYPSQLSNCSHLPPNKNIHIQNKFRKAYSNEQVMLTQNSYMYHVNKET